MTLGTACPTALAQKALTELRPLGRGCSEVGGLFGEGVGGGGGVTKVATSGLQPTLRLGGLSGLEKSEGLEG